MVMTGTQEFLGLLVSLPFWIVPVLALVNMAVRAMIRLR